jgi:UDP-N-acetylmuramyl pentapeptide phosphotransferase/UDP-N-acetylglucosamine-1-phosphate transferase
MAAVVFVAAIALCYGMKYLLPETEVRLELSFMINALIAILGIVATVNGRTAVAGVSSVDRQSLAGVLALLIIGATAGFIIYNRKIKKQIKQI